MMKKKRIIAKLLVIIILVTLLPSRNVGAEDVSTTTSTDTLITHYTMAKTGNMLTDVSGNGHDATLVGFESTDFMEENGSTVLSFTGNKSKYVKLPDGVVGDDETFTIEATFNTSTKANHWLYCLGTKEDVWPNVNNYVFCNPMQANSGSIRCGLKDSSNEKLNQSGNATSGVYNTITAVYASGKISVYLNAVLVGTVDHTYLVQDILKNGVKDKTDAIGYIGKSLYTPDPALIGKLSDFKVYNYSLTAKEIKEKTTLITHYKMNEKLQKLTDETGNGHDAQLVGFTNSDFVDDNGTKVLSFTGDKSKYVALPDGAVGKDETFTIETTFTTSTAANHWLYCLGAKEDVWPNVKNYVFCNPRQGNGTMRYGIKDSNDEKLNETGSINTSAYNTVTAAFSDGMIDLYMNGKSVGSIAHTYKVQDIIQTASGAAFTASGPAIIGYIGKSLYTPDPAFKGKVSEFKVYNYSLTAQEVAEKFGKIELTDAEIVDLAMKTLTIPGANDIRGNITLPDSTKEGAKLTWQTSDSTVISVSKKTNTGYDDTPAGVVTRQVDDKEVTLTATITSGNVTDSKEIKVTVKAKPVAIKESEYTDYLFTHFIGESGNTAEQIYFSSSQDGFHWTDLNAGEAVMTSSLGDGGVRDPFILRSPDGDKFYQIATDLCIGGGTSWGESQSSGSKALIIWESNDLVTWSNPRMVEVGVESAGCVWAPEAIYDEKTGEYLVYWASMVKLPTDSSAKQRIYYAKTRDFYTFTKPQIYLERENHVIDSTIIKYNDAYYRYSKDETTKRVGLDSSSQLLNSTWTTVNSEMLGSLSGVEGPLIYKLNEDDASKDTWCLMVDQYGTGGGYLPLITNDLSSGKFTKVSNYNLGSNLKRHGTILRITAKEYQALTKAYNNVNEVEEEKQENPVISYDFDESLSGNTVKDGSGNNHNGSLYGKATYVTEKDTNSQVLYLDGTNGSYAAFEDNFFTGRNTFTISMDIKSATTGGNFFTWTVGKDSNKYMFLKTNPTQIRNAFTKSSYGSEYEASAAVDSILNKWTNITIVVTDSAMVIYQNGVQIAKNKNLGVKMTDLGRNLVSYLGKSFYSGDAYFKGYFDNIKVYNRALSNIEVAQTRGISIAGLKGATVDGLQLSTSKLDQENHVLNLYFDKARSKNTDLSKAKVNLVMEEGFTLKTDLSNGIDLSKEGTSVTITADGLKTPQIWKIKGSFINNTSKKLLTYVVSGDTTRTDTLHYAYSTDGETFVPLNHKKAILYPTVGTKKMGNPVVFKKADGSYGLIATDNNSSSYIMLYDSKDLIHFDNERYVKLNATGITVTDIECSYDDGSKSYFVYWTGIDGKTYLSKTADFKSFTEPVIATYTMSKVTATLPDGAIESSVFDLTDSEFDKLSAKFGDIYSTKVSDIGNVGVKTGETLGKLTDSIEVSYSNGEKKTYGITWDQKELNKINTKVNGSYTITGRVNTNEYTETPLIEERADPHVVKGDDGYYYFTASYPVRGSGTGYDRVVLRRATSIAGLATAQEVTIWSADTQSSGSYFRYIWAPEMHKIGNSWYIFCTASTSSSNVWSIRPHVLKYTGDNMMDPNSWTMLGIMKAKSIDSKAFTNFSLDMTYFECDGKSYVSWAQVDTVSSIFIATVDSSNPQQLTSDAVKISVPNYAWESSNDTVNEGPVAIQRNGKIYLGFSASSVDKTYCLGVLSADSKADLTNPSVWTKNAYPLLTTEDLVDQYGPGHNSYTTDEYGNTVIVYHARPENCANGECEFAASSDLNDPCRHTRMKQVFFDSEGLPVFNLSSEDVLPSKDRTVTTTIIVSESGKTYEGLKDTVLNTLQKDMLGSNDSIDKITSNLNFLKTSNGVTLSWSSSDSTVIAEDGTVTANNETSKTVTITVNGNYHGVKIFEKTYELTVLAKYTDNSGNTTGTIKEKKANITIGDTEGETVAVKVKVTNTKDSTGVTTDMVELGKEEALKVIKSVLSQKKVEVTIDLSDIAKDKNASDQIKLVLSKDVSEVFSQNKIGVTVNLPQISLVIPTSSIAKTEDGVSILVTDITQKKQTEATKELLTNMSKGAFMLGTPVDIHTNYALKTQIVLPIPESMIPTKKSERKKFVESLAILVQHSDGENRLMKGMIAYDETGKPTKMSVEIDKFSSFTLVKTNLNEEAIKYKTKKSANKVVTAKFSENIDGKTVTKDSVYALDSKGNSVDVKVSVKGNKIIVKPVKNYEAGKTYSVYVTKNVCYTNGKEIAKAKKYVFTIKK